MREAHAHIAAYGQSLNMPDLAACRSVEECLDTVTRASASLPPGAWLRLAGARIESWDTPRWPTREELDAAADRPCIILSFDHHAASANSAAIAAAGLRSGQTVPPNGLVCADSRTGHATGLLIEHAAYAVWESAPEPSRREWKKLVHAGLSALAGHGYQEVHDLHSQDWLGGVLAELEREGRLPVREVRLYPAVSRLAAMHAGRGGWASARVRLAGGKLFADGTLNSRTALMLAPYQKPLNDQPCGRAMVSPRELDEAIGLCEAVGLHIAVHAIGDGAVRMVLDALERTATPRVPANRHRIEHCEIVDEADVPRFSRLAGGVVCSVQPCHLLADVEVLTRQLPGRLDRVLPLRELIAAGCSPGGDDALLWFGSDVPIVRPDAADSIQAAVHRRRADTAEAEAIGWEQRIDEPTAQTGFAVDNEPRAKRAG